jgi:hypothetical protein
MKAHTWEFCKFCMEDTVICGTCRNNCCNGGHGTVDGKDCPDCPSAYAMQRKYDQSNVQEGK